MSHSFTRQKDFLKKNFETGALAHAYLFSGKDLESVTSLAKNFVTLVHCASYQSNGRQVCGMGKKKELCHSCRLIEKGGHPDIFIIKREEEKREIPIEQARQAQHFLSYKPYYGGYKAVIVIDAQAMNHQAQSCFLKTLEEPKGKTLIVMVSETPEMMLPTILSRCQTVTFHGHKNDVERNQQWLKDLVPLMHSDLAEKFRYVKNTNLNGENFYYIMSSLQWYFRNLLLLRIGMGQQNEPLEKNDYSIAEIKKILTMIDDVRGQSMRANINHKLALEALLLEI